MGTEFPLSPQPGGEPGKAQNFSPPMRNISGIV